MSTPSVTAFASAIPQIAPIKPDRWGVMERLFDEFAVPSSTGALILTKLAFADFLSKAALLDSVVSQVDADAVFDRYKTGNTLLFEQFPSVIADLASLKFPDAKPVTSRQRVLNSYLIPLFRRVTEGVPPPQGLPPAPLTISGGEGDRAGAPPPAGTDDNVVIGDVVESGSGEVGEEGYSVGEDESGSQGPDEHFEDYDDSDEYDQEVEGIAGSKGGGSKFGRDFWERQAIAAHNRRQNLDRIRAEVEAQEVSAMEKYRMVAPGTLKLLRGRQQATKSSQVATAERLHAWRQNALAKSLHEDSKQHHDTTTDQPLFHPRVVKQRGLSASGRPTPGKLLPVVSSISTEQHLASADSLYRDEFEKRQRILDKAAQAEYEAKLRASRPKWNKLSAEYLRRGLARELCAFVVAAVGKHPAKSVELTDMLDPNSPNVWSRQFLCFDEVADACITLGFVSTTRAVKHEDVELPAAALISDADKKLLTRLWSVLIPRGVEEVSAARFLSFLQAIMTGASDLSRAVLDDACRSSRVDRGLPSPRGKAQPKPEGDDDGDAQPVPLLQDAPPGTDSAAATSSTRAGFESGFSRLLLLVEKHKRAAAASDASASDVDTVDGEENGSSVHAIPTKLAAAWATSPEAFGVGVVWDERLLKLFKPLCMCRVATANRTRGVRQRLHAVAQESGDDGVQTEKVLGKPVLVCAALGSPPPPTHYDKECTFVPTICPKSQKMAEVNRGPVKERIESLYRATDSHEYREKLKARAEAVKEELFAECTFQPNLGPTKARKPAEEKADGDTGAHERLYLLHEVMRKRQEKRIQEAKEAKTREEMAECSFQPNPSKSGQKPFEGGKTAGSTYKPWALTDAGQVPDSLGLGDTQQGSGDFELDDDENSGLASRLKPDTSAPVPKGFTKAIERLRKGQQDRENMQRVFEELSKGSVVRKAVVRDEKGRTVHQPFTLQTEKRAATREAAPQLGITGLLDQAGVPQAAYAQPPTAPENVEGGVSPVRSSVPGWFAPPAECQGSGGSPPQPTPLPRVDMIRPSGSGAEPPQVDDSVDGSVASNDYGGVGLAVTIKNDRHAKALPPLLFVDVKLSATKTERVALWETSDLDDMCAEFGSRFGLKPEARLKLRALLSREREEVLRSRRSAV